MKWQSSNIGKPWTLHKALPRLIAIVQEEEEDSSEGVTSDPVHHHAQYSHRKVHFVIWLGQVLQNAKRESHMPMAQCEANA
jgi:hypothetical protein